MPATILIVLGTGWWWWLRGWRGLVARHDQPEQPLDDTRDVNEGAATPADADSVWAWVKCLRGMCDAKRLDNAECRTLPAPVSDWLLLSDEKHARDIGLLTRLGVTHVLTTNGMPRRQLEGFAAALSAAGIQHRAISADDSEGYPLMERHWSECRSFLEAARGEGGKVVVHCVAGINRSGLVTCAVHMVTTRTNVLDAVRHVKRVRGSVLWNHSFQEQLVKFALQEGLLGPKPEGFTDEAPSTANAPLPPPPAHIALDRLL
jgi:protein-tyrosine phosphatase